MIFGDVNCFDTAGCHRPPWWMPMPWYHTGPSQQAPAGSLIWFSDIGYLDLLISWFNEISISIHRYPEMPNKSPFDTPYTGRSGNNEAWLFAYDIYVTRKIQYRDTWRKSNEIGLHRGRVLFLYEYTWSHHVMYTWTRSARNVSMIQLARALKRKYHFDEIFITGCTGNCLPVQSVIKILSKWRHSASANFWIYLLVAYREWTRLAQLCCRLFMKSDPIAE